MDKPYELTYFRDQIKSVLTLPERNIYSVGDSVSDHHHSGKIKRIEEREGKIYAFVKYYDQIDLKEIKVA
jgi:hypothetical protein